MSERPPIEGRVARILNARELAINRGALDGVRDGMVFDVLDPKAEDIEDPETGEVLGSVYRPKVQVRVFAVEDRLALARTFKSERVNLGGSGLGGFAKAFEPARWVERHETLKTTESTWQDLDESESIVKTGDPVVEAVVVGGAAEETGSRTLEHPKFEQVLVRHFSEWLRDEGWTVQPQTREEVPRLDVIASRGDEVLLAEAKAKRGPLTAADVAQAVGWLMLYPLPDDKKSRRVLVLDEKGLTGDAASALRAYPLVEIYRMTAEGGFEPTQGHGVTDQSAASNKAD